MKTKKQEKQSKRIYHKLTFWLGVLVVGAVLGSVIQFTRAWVEPTANAPGGNIAAPINTGVTDQTKTGDICTTAPNGTGPQKCLSSGTSGSGDCLCRTYIVGSCCPSTVKTDIDCGTGWENAWNYTGSGGASNSATGGMSYITYFKCSKSLSVYDPTYLYGGSHTEANCTAAGGAVITNGSDKFCKMDPVENTGAGGVVDIGCYFGHCASYYVCPSGWSAYKNFSESQEKTCTGTKDGDCSGTSCTAPGNSWENKPPASCNYSNGLNYPGSCYDDGMGNWICSPDWCSTQYPPGTCYAKVTKIGCY